MLNIGPLELILILLIALIFVGPKKLPELGRTIGKSLRELRKAQDEVRSTFNLLDEPPRAQRPTPTRRAGAADGSATGRREPVEPDRDHVPPEDVAPTTAVGEAATSAAAATARDGREGAEAPKGTEAPGSDDADRPDDAG